MRKKPMAMPWHLMPAIVSLAWPTMLEQLMQTAVQYVDTAMVGTLGTQATAAVGATTTVSWLVNGTVAAVGVGFLSYISQAFGARDKERGRKASAQAVLAVLVLGVLFTVLTLAASPFVPGWMQVDEAVCSVSARYFFVLYSVMLFRTATILFGVVLHAVGDTKTPMIIGVGVNLMNVVLNFLLIYPTRTVSVFGWGTLTLFGAGWGVVGAAVASAIAVAVGGICITAALWRKKEISPKGYSIKPDKTVLAPCLKVALPNSLQRFATSLGYVVFASTVNSLGEVATAAHTVANTVESLFYIPGYGMQTAAATLSGSALGAGDKDRIKALGKMMLFLEIGLMILSGALLFFAAPEMVGLFTKDPQVAQLGVAVLRMVAVSEPFFGAAIVIEGMMQGMGNTTAPFVCNICGMWGVRIGGAAICIGVFGLGLVSCWACMIAHNLLLFSVFTAFLISGRILPKARLGE